MLPFLCQANLILRAYVVYIFYTFIEIFPQKANLHE
jgi:hypothetical protein